MEKGPKSQRARWAKNSESKRIGGNKVKKKGKKTPKRKTNLQGGAPVGDTKIGVYENFIKNRSEKDREEKRC